MGYKEKSGEVVFASPKGEMKYSYFDLIMRQMEHLGAMISHEESGFSNSRIPLMVNFIISHVPEGEMRMEMREDLRKRLEKRLKDVVGSEDRTMITVQTYVEIVGHIADYLESYMGITKENRLGFIGVEDHGVDE